MPETIHVRKRKDEESFEDWYGSLIDDGIIDNLNFDEENSQIVFSADTGEIEIYSKEEYAIILAKQQEREKKSKRINLWVTESFQSDIQTLHQAYNEMSTSEMIVDIISDYIAYLKTDPFWNTLEEWQDIKMNRSKVFNKFMKSKKSE